MREFRAKAKKSELKKRPQATTQKIKAEKKINEEISSHVRTPTGWIAQEEK